MSPGTFEALTRHKEADVFLRNLTGREALRCTLEGAILTIEAWDNPSDDQVSWLVIAERADAFIKSVDNTDAEGRLIPEHEKPSVSAEELEVALAPREMPGLEAPEMQEAGELIGKKGFPRHYEALGIEPPRREVKPKATAEDEPVFPEPDEG